MPDARVQATGLGVRFLFNSQSDVVTPMRAKLALRADEAWGLRDLTVGVAPGEGVALIGQTGAGKTTLLRAIAGVLPADEGDLRVQGRVASMLATDAGLLPTLTGRENALVIAVLGGAPRAQAKSELDSMKERSGLGRAFDRPASTYSQGMQARLGFTAATACDPAIVLLDEVHEALDHRFRETLEQTVNELRSRGGIAIAAGHDHDVLSRICGRALLIEDGGIAADGAFEQIRSRYLDDADQLDRGGEDIGDPRPASEPTW